MVVAPLFMDDIWYASPNPFVQGAFGPSPSLVKIIGTPEYVEVEENQVAANLMTRNKEIEQAFIVSLEEITTLKQIKVLQKH